MNISVKKFDQRGDKNKNQGWIRNQLITIQCTLLVCWLCKETSSGCITCYFEILCILLKIPARDHVWAFLNVNRCIYFHSLK